MSYGLCSWFSVALFMHNLWGLFFFPVSGGRMGFFGFVPLGPLFSLLMDAFDGFLPFSFSASYGHLRWLVPYPFQHKGPPVGSWFFSFPLQF